jgi:CspA family cold shock protein
MKTGTVKFYNESKGFGFIKSDDGGKEVFVHATGIAQGTQLRENDKVTFEERDGKKGVNAVNVELCEN